MTKENGASQASPNLEDSDTTKVHNPAPKHSLGSRLLKYWHFFAMLLLILALVGTYVWKNMAVAKARAEVTQRAEQVISEQSKTYLRLVVIPLSWAVRGEMIRDNYDQVNQYLAQFIKEKDMKELVVAKPDGTVVAATNTKLQGAAITDSFPAEVLRADSITITARDNGEIMIVAPVMGLSRKIGVLVLVYMPVTFSLGPNP